MAKHNVQLVLVPCSGTQIDGVPEVIPLLPLGEVKSTKGNFMVDEESFRQMNSFFTERGVDIVIDYEHQTLHNVQAPAGGWIKELILKDNAICGRVEWTPKAVEYLKNKEYRYLSPVVMVSKADHKALFLTSVALTNVPAISGMIPIVNSITNFELEGEKNMDEFLKQLAALLGLPETATADDVTAAIQKLVDELKTLKEDGKNEVVANKMVLSLLSLKDDATTADITAKIAAMQNPANFVPIEQYNQLALKMNAQEGDGLVELALKDGKITPAQKDWAQAYVKTDKAGFEEFLKKAVPVVPMQQLALKSSVEPKSSRIDPDISKMLGLSAAEIEKYGKDD